MHASVRAFDEAVCDKRTQKKLRKQVMSILMDLIDKGLSDRFNGKPPSNKLTSPSPRRKVLSMDSVNCYGLLTNSNTNVRGLIENVWRNDSMGGEDSVELYQFYIPNQKKMFSAFPAAATYTNPYLGNEREFVEVAAEIDGVYICTVVDNLRYLELLNKKEKTNG